MEGDRFSWQAEILTRRVRPEIFGTLDLQHIGFMVVARIAAAIGDLETVVARCRNGDMAGPAYGERVRADTCRGRGCVPIEVDLAVGSRCHHRPFEARSAVEFRLQARTEYGARYGNRDLVDERRPLRIRNARSAKSSLHTVERQNRCGRRSLVVTLERNERRGA